MDADEIRQQEQIHDALTEALREHGDLDDRVVTGWVICWETATLSDEDRATSGHLYGPHGMTTWRALGLVEWARRFCLKPDEEDE